MRHAKSSWDDASVPDRGRPLNHRGKRVAPLVGKLMRERGFLPELIISSPAERARQTAYLVADACTFAITVEFDERIYEANPSRLLDVTGGITDGISSAMLVGHNPGMEGFIWHLTGTLEPMPTASVAILRLDIEKWADIRDGCGAVADLLRPKDEDL